MSGKTPFQILDDYCHENEKTQCVRDLAFSIYRQQFEDLTKDKANDQNAVNQVQEVLLSQGNLVAHVRSAEEQLEKQFTDELNRIKKRTAKESFWMNMLSGIVGNVIYSLLLIILFIIAKDQLSTWLSSLLQQPPSSISTSHSQTESSQNQPR